MMPDLVNMAGASSLTRCSSRSECEVARARADLQVERRHRLEVVVEDVGPGRHHGLDRAVLAQEVGGQHLDGGRRRRARGWRGWSAAKCSAPPSARSSRSTEVMTTCASPSLATAAATFCGSARIERPRQPGRHVAEGAGARAGIAHDHHGGVALRPALADVGAGRLLAHRDEPVRAQHAARLAEPPTAAGTRTRIQSGFLSTGVSGLPAFSGCRGRALVEDGDHAPLFYPARSSRQPAPRTPRGSPSSLRGGVSHKACRLVRMKLRAQHGRLGSVRAIATASLRWMVVIELGTWRCGQIGGAARSVTFG